MTHYFELTKEITTVREMTEEEKNPALCRSPFEHSSRHGKRLCLSTNYDGTCTYCGHDCTDLASKAERRKALDPLDKLALHGNPYESSPENKENFHFTK